MAYLILLLLAPPETHVVETAHYRLHSDGTKEAAEEQGRLLEAAFVEYRKYFKRKLKLKKGKKLVVRFLESRDAWSKAILADRGKVPETGGGHYWPPSKTVYLYRQPTAYSTRALLIHECAHQFHFLARTKNKAPAAAWYTEGIVEYLSFHHWDGIELRLGVKPTIMLEDYAAKALATASAPGFDLERFVEGEAMTRPVAWALFRFLAHGNGGKPVKRFTDFCKKMDGGVAAGPAFKRLIGPFARLQPEFLVWLEGEQQEWEQVFVEWQALGPGRFRGTSKVVSVCRLKKPVKTMLVTIDVPVEKRKRWLGGVLLSYVDKEDYAVALIDWAGFLRIHRRVGKAWKPIEQGEGPGPDKDGKYRLQCYRRGKNVMLMIGTDGYGPWELPGNSMGLAVDKGTVTFRDVSWKE